MKWGSCISHGGTSQMDTEPVRIRHFADISVYDTILKMDLKEIMYEA
jgi:hypothetical protein